MKFSLKRKSGFSLLEVMITLLLLAIGSLSLGYMQLESMATSYQSKQFSEAELIMEEIANTLSANRNLLDDSGELFQKKPGNDFPGFIQETVNGNTNQRKCKTRICNKQQISQTSLANWKQRINARLPVTNALLKDETFICRDSNPTDNNRCDGVGESFHIYLSWQDNSDPSNNFSSQLVVIP